MIRVQTKDFDPGVVLEQLRKEGAGKAGAIVSFTGLVRDLNQGERVSGLTLEHYPGMTEKVLGEIAAIATRRWSLLDVVIIHRIGSLAPTDRIVFVAAVSVHRSNAFRACEYLIDTLKTEAPFWKQEDTQTGMRWVGAAVERTPD